MKAKPIHRRQSPRDQLFVFEWWRDPAGYRLSRDGQRIVRKGGRLERYSPEEQDPPLYMDLAMLRVAGAEDWDPEEPEPAPNDPAAPLLSQFFPDEESAVLAFVNRYGFFGLEPDGPRAQSEPMAALLDAKRKLSLFVAAGLDTGDMPPREAFNWFNRMASLDLTIRIEPRGRHGGQQIRIVPRSLISWLWLRIAQDCTKGVTWHGPPCAWCAKPMPRGPGAYRAHAVYCSNRCRTYGNRAEAGQQQTAKESKRSKTRERKS